MPGKKRKQQERRFLEFDRQSRLTLARAIAENGLTGERKAAALARIAEAEKKGK
jgi:hypothetical protein